MRNERLIAIDQQKKLKDYLMEKELLLSKKDLEITHLKFAPQKNIAHEKQVQEMNDQIQSVQIERNQLLEKV